MLSKIARSVVWVGIFSILGSFFYYLVKVKADLISYVLLGVGIVLIGFYVAVEFQKLKTWFQWKKTTSYQFNAILMAVIIFGIISLLNFLGVRHTKRFDFTEQKLFSLAPQSIKVIKALKEEVQISGYFKSQEKPMFDDLLEKYKYHSDKIKVTFIDPDKDTAIAKANNVRKYQTIIVTRGKRETRIEGVSEEKLTNAIIQMGREKTPVVYFSKGHDEKDMKDTDREGLSQVQEELKKAGYEVKDLLLLETGKIPQDCDAFIIAGPNKPFLPNEVDLISAYLKQGGRAVLLIDPQERELGIESIIHEAGIDLDHTVVVDPVSTIFGQSAATPVVTTYTSHAVVQGMKVNTFFPMARSLTAVSNPTNKNLKVTALATTSPASWGETDPIKSGKVQMNEGKDKKGPLNIAMVSEGNWQDASKKENEMRLVVFGDSDFVNNRSYDFAGNGDFFMNSVAWLAEDEASIAIRPKEAKGARFMLQPTDVRLIFILTVILLPLAIMASGIFVWWRRRQVA